MSERADGSMTRNPIWRLTNDFLVEVLADEGMRLWGRWDRHFGCWNGDGLPVFPEDPLLGRLGVWLDPAGERNDEWYASRAALAAFWSIVPTSVRLETSRCGGQQWATLVDLWNRDRSGTNCGGLSATNLASHMSRSIAVARRVQSGLVQHERPAF